VTKADSGLMQTNTMTNAMELTLYNGHSYTDEGMLNAKKRKTFPFRRLKFGKEVVSITLPDTDFKRTDEDAFRSHALMLNLSQLQHRIDSVQAFVKDKKAGEAKRYLATNYQKSKNNNRRQDSILRIKSKDMYKSSDSLYLKHEPDDQHRALSLAVQFAREIKQKNEDNKHYYAGQQEQVIRNQLEWHRKFSLSFACFIFFFIGAPLGAIIRKGGLGMPVVVSVFLFIIYYIIDMMGIRSAREAVILPQIGAWISSFVLLPLGILLTYKAVTDSSMMNIDAYNHFFKKIIAFFKKKSHAES
jgi:lipopolysaccharide export system permease protein